jgi:hypothetical protein
MVVGMAASRCQPREIVNLIHPDRATKAQQRSFPGSDSAPRQRSISVRELVYVLLSRSSSRILRLSLDQTCAIVLSRRTRTSPAFGDTINLQRARLRSTVKPATSRYRSRLVFASLTVEMKVHG